MGPAPVDRAVEGEEVLPPPHRVSFHILRDHRIEETDRRALLKETRVGRPPARIPMEDTVGLVVGEPERLLEHLDRELLPAHRCHRRQRCGLVLRRLRLLPPGLAVDRCIDPGRRGEVVQVRPDAAVIRLSLEAVDEGGGLDQVKEDTRVATVRGR